MARTKRKAQTNDVQPEKAKKSKKTAKAPAKATPKADPEKAEEAGPPARIVIEACKQCQAFKKRATHVESFLTSKKPELTVSINPEKPRRGCFEIRDTKSGEKYISLLDMPRPFTKMKAVDMDELSEEILSKLED